MSEANVGKTFVLVSHMAMLSHPESVADAFVSLL